MPTHRSRGAVGVGLVEQVGGLGGRLVGREADALGLPDEAVADGAQVLPAEAGPTGSPVARSQTIVEARWLVMPTAPPASNT